MIIHIQSLLHLYHQHTTVGDLLYVRGWGNDTKYNGRNFFSSFEVAMVQYSYLSLTPEDLPMILATAKPGSLAYIVAQKILQDY